MSSSSFVVRPSEACGEDNGWIQLDTHVQERKQFLTRKVVAVDNELQSPKTEFLVQAYSGFAKLAFFFAVWKLCYIFWADWKKHMQNFLANHSRDAVFSTI